MKSKKPVNFKVGKRRVMRNLLSHIPYIIVGLLILSTFYITLDRSKTFKINQCVQYNGFRESWEPDFYIHKILEVGQKSYKIATYGEDPGGRFLIKGGRLSFKDTQYYNMVECPK